MSRENFSSNKTCDQHSSLQVLKGVYPYRIGINEIMPWTNKWIEEWLWYMIVCQ